MLVLRLFSEGESGLRHGHTINNREWNYFCFFFFVLIKVTKASPGMLQYDVHDIRPTVRDVMVMYSKERYMENLPYICIQPEKY